MKERNHPLLFEIKRSIVEFLVKNKEVLESDNIGSILNEMQDALNDRDTEKLELMLKDVDTQEIEKAPESKASKAKSPRKKVASRKKAGGEVKAQSSAFLSQLGADLFRTLHEVKIDIDPVRLFISYSTVDKTRVRPFQSLFEASPYVEDAFIDSFDINPGVLYKEAIHNALTDVDAIVVFLTEGSAKSEWVQKEIATGKSNHTPIIPVILDKSILTNLDEAGGANKKEKSQKEALIDLLNTNGVRGFSLLPCEIVHKTICAVNRNKFMGRIGNEKLQAQNDEREKYFSSILDSIQHDYNKQDGDYRWAIHAAEELLLTNENEDDRSTRLLELLINLYLLDKASSGDIDDGFSRNAFENIKKLLYRLLNKRSNFGIMTENTELEPIEYQNLPLMFKLALVLVMQEKYYEAFQICLRLCNSPRFSDDMRLSSQIEAVTLGLADVISKLTDRSEIEEYVTDRENEFGKTKEQAAGIDEAKTAKQKGSTGSSAAGSSGGFYEEPGFRDTGKVRYIVTADGTKIRITVEDINEHFVKASYIDWGIVHNVLSHIRHYFNTFGQKADHDPWTYVNFGFRRIHPKIREHFVGSPPPLSSAQEAELELMGIKRKKGKESKPKDYYQQLPDRIYNAACFYFLFVKYFKETMGFRSRKWSDLDEDYMRGLVGECESFIQEDMKLGAETFHHDLLAYIAENRDTNPFGNDYFIHWVELSSSRRIERIIQNKIFHTMGSVYTAGYFDEVGPDEDVKFDEQVLRTKLERMLGKEKMKNITFSKELPLRCLQEEVLYFTRSLITHIEHKINISVPGFDDGHYKTFLMAVEKFWREEVVSVVHLHHFMTTSTRSGNTTNEGDSSKKFETLNRKEQLCYQIMFAILETFRSFRTAEHKPGAIKEKVRKRLPGWAEWRAEHGGKTSRALPRSEAKSNGRSAHGNPNGEGGQAKRSGAGDS